MRSHQITWKYFAFAGSYLMATVRHVNMALRTTKTFVSSHVTGVLRLVVVETLSAEFLRELFELPPGICPREDSRETNTDMM